MKTEVDNTQWVNYSVGYSRINAFGLGIPKDKTRKDLEMRITSIIRTPLEFNPVQDVESKSTLFRFWQGTSTNRTYFFSWSYHQIGFALGAFDSVEFD